MSWIVKAQPAEFDIDFVQALGVTCQEVFAVMEFPDDALSVVRIRLDSLGPGVAPD